MKRWTMTGPASPELAEFDAAMKAYRTQHDVPGGVLAVEKDGRLVLARGYTWAEADYPVTQPTSLFRIASCSKPITNVAIYQLVERGALALTDNVQAILNLKTPSGQEP